MKKYFFILSLLFSPLAIAGTPFMQMTKPKPVGVVTIDGTSIPAFSCNSAYEESSAFDSNAKLKSRTLNFSIPKNMNNNFAVYVTARGIYLLPRGMRYTFNQGGTGAQSLHMRNQSDSIDVEASIQPGASWNNNKTTIENKIVVKGLPTLEKEIIKNFAHNRLVQEQLNSID